MASTSTTSVENQSHDVIIEKSSIGSPMCEDRADCGRIVATG